MRWTAADLPDLTGRTVVVTGATSGLGEATTVALATRGAHVVLATRSEERTTALMDRIRCRAPSASMEHLASTWRTSTPELTGVGYDLPVTRPA